MDAARRRKVARWLLPAAGATAVAWWALGVAREPVDRPPTAHTSVESAQPVRPAPTLLGVPGAAEAGADSAAVGRAYRLSGQVLGRDELPMPSGRVTMFRTSLTDGLVIGAPLVASVDDTGRFSGLLQGEAGFNVVAWYRNERGPELGRSVIVDDGHSDEHHTTIIAQIPAQVEIRVVDRADRPVPGAVVRVTPWPRDAPGDLRTNAEGVLHVDLMPGPTRIRAESGPTRDGGIVTTLVAGRTRQLKVVIERERVALSVAVIPDAVEWPRGTPVQVTLATPPHVAECRIEAGGADATVALCREERLTVTLCGPAGFVHRLRWPSVAEAAPAGRLVLSVAHLCTLRLRCEDDLGAALPGLQVALRPVVRSEERGQAQRLEAEASTALSDGRGVAEWRDLTQGEYVVHLAPMERRRDPVTGRRQTREWGRLSLEGRESDVTMAFPGASRLDVTYDGPEPSGHAPLGVRLSWFADGDRNGSLRTFRTDVPSGASAWTVSLPCAVGTPVLATVESGSRPVLEGLVGSTGAGGGLRIDARTLIEGLLEVRDAAGGRLQGGVELLRASDGEPVTGTLPLSATAGTVRLPLLPAGAYRVRLLAQEGQSTERLASTLFELHPNPGGGLVRQRVVVGSQPR